MEKLKYLIIRFSDNDFYAVYCKLAACILLAERALPTDKNKLSFLVNQLLFGMYVLFQNPFKYNGMEKMDSTYIDHMRAYLQIDPTRILVNEDAVEYKLNTDWDNGETLYVDLENKQWMVF